MNRNRLPQAVALGLVTEATLRHATTTRLHKLILAGVFDSTADNYRSLDMPPGAYVGRLSAHLVCLQAIRHVVRGLPCDDAVHRWGACLAAWHLMTSSRFEFGKMITKDSSMRR